MIRDLLEYITGFDLGLNWQFFNGFQIVCHPVGKLMCVFPELPGINHAGFLIRYLKIRI